MTISSLRTSSMPASPAYQFFATVAEQTEQTWRLHHDDALLTAQRAAGCLLAPAVGDRVLAAADASGTWILCVLERDPSRPALIDAPGDVHIQSNGQVKLDARSGMNLSSRGELAMNADLVRVNSSRLEAITGHLNWLAERVTARVGLTRFIGQAMESLFDRVSSHCRISMRQVDQLDQLSAGRIDRRASGDISMQSENLVAGARNLAKVDGKQIHIG